VRTSGCNLRCGYCDTPYASWTPEGEDLSVAEILDRIEGLAILPSPFGRGAGGEGCGGEIAENTFFPLADRPHPSPLPEGEGTDVQPLPEGEGTDVQPLPEGEGTDGGLLPEGEGTMLRHAVLTGGEPMLTAELIPLAAQFRARGWHITIETSGTLYLPVACDLMSISPKLSNSTPPPELDPQWTWRHTLNRHAPEVIRRLTAEYDYQLKFVIDRPEDCDEVEGYLAEFPEIAEDCVMMMPQGIDEQSLAEKAVWLEPYCVRRGFQFCPRRQVEWFGATRGK
jgi:7-carboxy-7-deazaguanine synthase